VKRRQRLFKDQPESPLERGIFWTEYVIRHGYDTGLRSPTRDMSWFEMYAVNVWLVVGAILTSTAAILVLVLSCLYRRISRSFRSNAGEVKTTNDRRGEVMRLGVRREMKAKVA
jgi:glucuronosyltransferase